ncbi:hypothetical protein HS041_20690 [Planomonospora sp. ID67723]|uniref:hypothetical protein n=1 Tax=Planomonospora sp. ID67723 TaxID=2738134 RepID=UPI0018C38B7A|nr:hypothetical protein [Planomonospora sp. ID67723]MBG0830186.1 hypothetical protein [Planomonospora sp. ID67723]
MDTTITQEKARWARRERWARWAAPAAGVWSLGYGALGLWWSRGGPGFPFGEGDVPDARAESFLGSATAAGTAPVIAVLGAGGALLAPLLALVRPRGVLRALALVSAWSAAFTLVALVPDARVLLALAYAPIFLAGAPWGWPDADYFEVALPWPVLNLLVCLAGGVLWGAAALAFQRRTRGACESCGRVEGRAPGWASPASAERWGRRAAYVAFAVPLFYAVVRWAWALGIPLLLSERDLDGLHRSGLVWAGAALATLAAIGGVLALGLTQRWGEIWPRWVVGLAGRRVPPAFPVVFASLVTAVLASAGATAVRITDWSDPAAWLLSPMAYWPLWAVALGVATLGYHLRRRGRCRRCG